MTLIIETVAKTNIVLTADGLSHTNPITGAGIESKNLQKIFSHSKFPQSRWLFVKIQSEVVNEIRDNLVRGDPYG
jgi:hypothetical protein